MEAPICFSNFVDDGCRAAIVCQNGDVFDFDPHAGTVNEPINLECSVISALYIEESCNLIVLTSEGFVHNWSYSDHSYARKNLFKHHKVDRIAHCNNIIIGYHGVEVHFYYLTDETLKSYTLPFLVKETVSCIAASSAKFGFALGTSSGKIVWVYNTADAEQMDDQTYVYENDDMSESDVEVTDYRMYLKWTILHWHSSDVLALKFSPNGTFLYSSGAENVLVKWDLSNHMEKSFLARLPAPVCAIDVSWGGISLALENGVRLLYDCNYKLLHQEQSLEQFPPTYFRGMAKSNREANIFKSPVGLLPLPLSDGKLLLTNGCFGRLSLIDASSGKVKRSFNMTKQQVDVRLAKFYSLSENGPHWLVTYEELIKDTSVDNQSRLNWWIFDAVEEQVHLVDTLQLAPFNSSVEALLFFCFQQTHFLLLLTKNLQLIILNLVEMAASNHPEYSPWQHVRTIDLTTLVQSQDYDSERCNLFHVGHNLLVHRGSWIYKWSIDSLLKKIAPRPIKSFDLKGFLQDGMTASVQRLIELDEQKLLVHLLGKKKVSFFTCFDVEDFKPVWRRKMVAATKGDSYVELIVKHSSKQQLLIGYSNSTVELFDCEKGSKLVELKLMTKVRFNAGYFVEDDVVLLLVSETKYPTRRLIYLNCSDSSLEEQQLHQAPLKERPAAKKRFMDSLDSVHDYQQVESPVKRKPKQEPISKILDQFANYSVSILPPPDVVLKQLLK
ncbi:hypothetical protein Ciccas_002025 [Cichlidogyrus casuarinus]|uniref:WD repeat-containing protein 75 n=1 Tax=Cichlidogyrus casuarinus TaxID=1844966 RepID=A0ABD2QIY4_9PLAT